MVLVSSNYKYNSALWKFSKFSTSKKFKAFSFTRTNWINLCYHLVFLLIKVIKVLGRKNRQ